MNLEQNAEWTRARCRLSAIANALRLLLSVGAVATSTVCCYMCGPTKVVSIRLFLQNTP